MILFFDIKQLEKEAKNNSIKFVSLLEQHYRIVHKLDKFSKIKYLNGSSYLLNALPLFKLSIDKAYIVQYISLAAKRDYTLYKLFNDKSLPLSFCPEVDISKIKYNPLLNLTKTNIYFKFEELINVNEIRRY